MIVLISIGTPISGTLLMSKALHMYPLIYKDEENTTFKAGTGWLKRFKDRHGVRALAIQGESCQLQLIALIVIR